MRTSARTLLVPALVTGAVWTSGCGEQSQQPMPSTEAGTTLPVCGLAPQQCQDDSSCAVASAPCDGGVVGTWNAMDCALELTGEVDVSGLALGCAYGTITTGSLQVSGTWSADASGNVLDATTTRGAQEFELTEACLSIAVAPPVTCGSLGPPFERGMGYDTLECVDNVETGGCTCRGTFKQQGGLGVISPNPLRTGRYSAAGTLLTTTDRGLETTYEYCVKGENMALTLPNPGPIGLVRGPIVLQRQ